ncbi:hypothetical protein [Amycolatopsis sp. BJA-103]|uniref:hypothetical protein n=1 Tax=Amycolatopsis sp. BJA-103 TaxID=1911175 RepID=UPI001304A49E|nr:hypothetical protein [Amycolatopsis sp. BJA-103]
MIADTGAVDRDAQKPGDRRGAHHLGLPIWAALGQVRQRRPSHTFVWVVAGDQRYFAEVRVAELELPPSIAIFYEELIDSHSFAFSSSFDD